MSSTTRIDKEESLARAMALFWRQGYEATSMKDIEHELALHPGSVYAAFGSKRALFEAALESYGDAMQRDLERRLASGTSPLSSIRQYLYDIGDALSERAPRGVRPVRACMVVKTLLEAGTVDPDLERRADRLLSAMERQFERALIRARERGEIGDDVDPARLARFLQMQIMGLRTFAQRNVPRRVVGELTGDIVVALEHYAGTGRNIGIRRNAKKSGRA